MNQLINRIFLLIIFISCNKIDFENICDFKSDQFTKTVILFSALGENIYRCGDYNINIGTGILEIDPTVGNISETGSSITIGSSVTFKVRLRKAPNSNVNLQINSTQPLLGTLSVTNLTFTKESWSTSQNFSLTAINDTIRNGSRNFKLILQINSEDEDFNNVLSDIPIQLSDNDKRLFLSTSSYRGGEFGGISGADIICNADINCPQGSNCKAMILGNNRVASITANVGDGQLDWVLHPYSHYYLPDEATLIANTNGNSLLQIPFAAVIDAINPGAWLGSNSGYVIGSNTCINWTDSSGGNNGYIFRTQYADNTLFGGNYLCSNPVKLFCVEY